MIRLNPIVFRSLWVALFISLLGHPDAVFGQSEVATQARFRIKLDDSLKSEPVSGRVMVFFSRRSNNPMRGPNWFSPEPFFGKDVVDVKPGDEVILDNSVRGFPGSLDDVESGTWKVQAVLDHDFFFANHSNGPGNFYSDVVEVEFNNGADNGDINLQLKNVIKAKPLPDTDSFKLVKLESKLLSDFHKREVYERAGVILPASYDANPEKRYPVYYEVTGFGGSLPGVRSRYGSKPPITGEGEAEFIHVYLTGQCKWGHHVYADSATNGPRGEALIKEMIPHIDSTFRTIAEPTARFVGGHSSGGWSSLWLQVTYPETFGGCWSTAPDPVDFRDWQGSDIYTGESAFYEADGKTKKPLARRQGKVMLWYADFCKMDDAMGRGGQIRSFEAVFSPKGKDGLPRFAFDRKTGLPDPEVIEYWKRYDIGLTLQNNWDQLKDKLAGKVHVYMGDVDTFYLEGATVLLGQRLQSLGSDAVVEIFPGKDHGSLMTRSLRKRIKMEMTDAFRKNHPE
jgi:hypothetical protein